MCKVELLDIPNNLSGISCGVLRPSQMFLDKC